MKAMMLTAVLSLSSLVQAAEKAPDFSLPDENGKVHNLKDYAGKIVVLEWTNPSCPFVKAHYEKKTMTTLAKKYAPQNVAWVAVDSGFSSTPAQGKEWKKAQTINYPILYDADGKVGKLYNATNTPQIVVIDTKGEIAYRGAIDDDPQDKKSTPINYVSQTLDALLQGKKVAVNQTKAYGCSVKFKKQ